jgi:hypothetical protein
MNGLGTSQGKMSIDYDMGQNTRNSAMSTAAKAALSTLSVIYLLLLIALTVYSCPWPVWTDQHNFLAIKCIGASKADKIDMWSVKDKDRIGLLVDIPGCIGDITEGKADVGDSGLGTDTGITAKQKVKGYGV